MQFDRLRDVIGRAVVTENVLFVPAVGYFDFQDDRFFLEDCPGSEVIPSFIDEFDWNDRNCWWVRARLLATFGINHPVGGNLSQILDCVLLAIFLSESSLVARPVLLSSLNRDEWAPMSAALSFDASSTNAERQLIAKAFWNLLLNQPTCLGVFSDYIAVGWHDCSQELDQSSEGAFYQVSCDGLSFSVAYLGDLNPDWSREELESFDRSEFWGTLYPFDLPRKARRNNGMHAKHSVVRF
jgi:hypothetical protein